MGQGLHMHPNLMNCLYFSHLGLLVLTVVWVLYVQTHEGIDFPRLLILLVVLLVRRKKIIVFLAWMVGMKKHQEIYNQHSATYL
jgi:NhaP-type Na+/H+ or K+/H+ antiporter